MSEYTSIKYRNDLIGMLLWWIDMYMEDIICVLCNCIVFIYVKGGVHNFLQKLIGSFHTRLSIAYNTSYLGLLYPFSL